MNIIFFGTPDFVVPIAEKLRTNFNLVAVVTTPDHPLGRKKIMTPTPVASFASQFNIPVYKPDTIDDLKSVVTNFKSADIFVVAAYGKILPKEILDIPKFGALNIHPSLLPKYRGPSPIQATLLSGDMVTGVTLIKMDEDVDHGPVLHQETVALSPTDTFYSLAQKLFAQAAQFLPQVIEDYTSSRISPVLQKHNLATFTTYVTKENGYFDLDKPPQKEELDRMIRAYYPWPGVWTRIRMSDGIERVIKFLPDTMIQMEGKNPVHYNDFLNGYPELQEKIKKLFS